MSRLALDARALWAATRKEWWVMRRYPARFAAFVFWPVVLPAVYVLQAQAFAGGQPAALQAFAERTGTSSIAGFIYLGWSMYMWLSLVLWGPGSALREQQVQGQLEAVLVTPASRAALLFGPVGATLLVTLWLFAVVGLALRLGFRVEFSTLEALRALAVVVVATPAISGLGALFSVLVLMVREVNGLVQLVRGLFTVFCGTTFPIAVLPAWAHAVALGLPPTYVIADIRQTLLMGVRLARMLPDLALLVGAGVVCCGLALVAFTVAERYAHRGGALGEH